jgi:DNA invertase Pin-like site-specific DNA recombinase
MYFLLLRISAANILGNTNILLRSGDTLVVWRLDRLGRSLKDLIQLTETLKERGVGLKSLKESIDTTTSSGQLIFHLFAALAEFERNLIRERTNAGLAAARARGRRGGRPKALDANKRKLAVEPYHKNEHSTAVRKASASAEDGAQASMKSVR